MTQPPSPTRPPVTARPAAGAAKREFSVNELILSRARVWGIKPAMIRAAFRTEGRTHATPDEAEQLVKRFSTMQVTAEQH